MRINTIEIQNFRKLKSCKIEFSERETIFVGANNSGKTTAMDALITFLKTENFKTQDFTLSNWKQLNKIGKKWINENIEGRDKLIKQIDELLPVLDIWLHVESFDLHYVSHIIPTLDWKGGVLGIRLRYEPKDVNILMEDFSNIYKRSNQLLTKKKTLKLWPKDFWDFCERRLNTYFSIKAYLLDPDKYGTRQTLADSNIALNSDILKGLIKIDIINAQRGFSDVNSDNVGNNNLKNLSSQLRAYYDKHLNPSLEPTESDLAALEYIHIAQKAFDDNLKESFQTSLSELEELNYPGFGNPQIQLSTKISTSDGLQHDSAVQYCLEEGLSLPEKYNGLGYQNLISIIFKLIRFRDEWMRKGKDIGKDDDIVEPLHLVLIEEPEAHLHAQVQQVFIKKAYDVLRNNAHLRDSKRFTTQLIISTHSSYIAHQKFICLRYFKRKICNKFSISEVVNLSRVFGSEDETAKFVIRYLSTTHNDIFFADAVILVEGAAERMLLPHFIKNGCNTLDNCYITILEIGGSHAHRLKPLIEVLGVLCLIITDLDSEDPKKGSKCKPEIGKGLITNNDTLKSWYPCESDLDTLLTLPSDKKVKTDLPIRVAYQKAIELPSKSNNIIVYPYTFEDSLVIENKDMFKAVKSPTGLLKKMMLAANCEKIEDVAESAYKAINAKGVKKAEFALDVLYIEDPKKFIIPNYIKEGLDWLELQLSKDKQGLNIE